MLTLLATYGLPITVSLISGLAWWFIFSYYSPQNTIKATYSAIAFVLGICVVPIVLILEDYSFSISQINTNFLNPFFVPKTPGDLLAPFIFSFLLAACIEEGTKFIILRKFFDVAPINQVVDGMKLGVAMGLGFACLENIFYFLNIYSDGLSGIQIGLVLILRGLLPTLAHAIYGVMMGYYLALSKFHPGHKTQLLKKSLALSVLAHGFFNFFLITNLGFYSVFMIGFFFFVSIMWYSDRKNLTLYIESKGKTLIVPPFLAEQLEVEILLGKGVSQERYLEKLWGLLMNKKD